MRVAHCVVVIAGLLLTVRCAHVEPPSGGPEDDAPPALLVSRPDSFSVVPDWDSPIVLVFDERVSEQEIEAAVRVSPLTSPVVVDHSGDELRVSLREGWEPGIIYQVVVLPGIRDLFGNERERPLNFVFSTGPAIPATAVRGTVVDRITGEPLPTARVELIRSADSLVYTAAPDTAGEIELRHLPTGTYLVRAYEDRDLDLALDLLEPRDTASIDLSEGDTARVALAIVEPDSTGPRLASAALVNGVLELRFDDFLDPTPPAAPFVEARGPDGARLEIDAIGVGSIPASDSVAASDTATTALPSQTLMVRFQTPAEFRPGETYQVIVRAVVNVAGLRGEGEAEFIAQEIAVDTLQADTLPADTVQPDTSSAAHRIIEILH